MQRELSKNYNPKDFEKRLYEQWLQKGCFHAPANTAKTPYSIVIPPPNITGQLHMGHALMVTVQDILIRHKRMQGYSSMWLPGTDHASIATEARIVEEMRTQGITKEGIGREDFLKRAWDWKGRYGDRINLQLRELGASLDWERERFTLDEGCNDAVNEVFCRLYEEGLIYRAKRMVNWCPVCVTAISDAEVDHEEKEGSFWHILYPLEDKSGNIEIATTRPETLLGDTAVAVNPKDERYKEYIGKYIILPLVGRRIPIIADEYVDPNFGTGAVKITPAHDPNDYEVGKRHNLPVEVMLNDDGTITENYERYAGQKRFTARKNILATLTEQGLLVQTRPHKHSVGTCSRCDNIIEPMLSLQWFVKMEPLAKPAVDIVKSGRIEFVPARFEKIYMHWMENIKDWCISRRLWWGHRIPAYHCSCGEIVVSKTPVDICPKCNGTLTQDADTLDTWFSSALWPFSTLGWPGKTDDLSYFFPTDTLVTGYDIIFFWVARMIFSSLKFMDDVPFRRVLLTGIVRDEQGRKMSKSLGNGIDPLKIIDEYGADALRYSMIIGTTPGADMRVSFEKIKAGRNFANKLWNATRFLLMGIGDTKVSAELPCNEMLSKTDRWTLSRYYQTVSDVNEHLEKLDVALALGKIEDFIWNVFCDFTIEFSKIVFSGEDPQKIITQRQFLLYILRASLLLLHPFMPFVTEEIYQNLPGYDETIMTQKYPNNNILVNIEEQKDVDAAIEVIKAVRNLRSERKIIQKQTIKMHIETAADFSDCNSFISGFCNAELISDPANESVIIVTSSAKIKLPLSGLIDSEKEKARLLSEKVAVTKEIDFLTAKLENKAFVDKAPAELVNRQNEKLITAKHKLQSIIQSLQDL